MTCLADVSDDSDDKGINLFCGYIFRGGLMVETTADETFNGNVCRVMQSIDRCFDNMVGKVQQNTKWSLTKT